MPPQPAFEVASVKPHDPRLPALGFRGSALGTLVISGMSLKQMIETAYFLKDYQLIGAPKWTESALYDISAKDSSAVDADTGKLTEEERRNLSESLWPRFRALLAERFELKVHQEERPANVSALVVAKGGQLQSVACDPNGGYYLRPGLAKGAMKLSSLAAVISQELNTKVADNTNLAGCYKLDLTWTTDPQAGPDGDSPPSLASALQSLGLRLNSRRGSVEVFVVDHVARPPGN
jgi:uncharacterized protein (TIGR03435 family)